jgi:hypothetical protein
LRRLPGWQKQGPQADLPCSKFENSNQFKQNLNCASWHPKAQLIKFRMSNKY